MQVEVAIGNESRHSRVSGEAEAGKEGPGGVSGVNKRSGIYYLHR